MRLPDLNDQERAVLGAMLRLMIRSDGEFSFEEEQAVIALGTRLGDGPGALIAIANASEQTLPDATAVQGRLGEVTRPEARALIRDVLTEVAGSDALDPAEEKLLCWLDTHWT